MDRPDLSAPLFGVTNAGPAFAEAWLPQGIRLYRGGGPLPWEIVEPSPPGGEGDAYEWCEVDAAISALPDGALVEILLGRAPEWACKPGTYQEEPWRDSNGACPVAEEHLEDLEAFAFALVERYDGDGIADMPGLSVAIYAYQFGNEWYNASQWLGSPQEYVEALAAIRRGLKAADPDTILVLSEVFEPPRFPPPGFDEPTTVDELEVMIAAATTTDPRLADIVEFMDTTLRSEHYDVAITHHSREFRHLGLGMEYMRRRMEEGAGVRPIWTGDSASAPLLAGELLSYAYDPANYTVGAMSYLETELGLLCVLSSRASAGPADDRLGPRCEEIDKTPEQVSEDEYQRVRSWYRRVQGEWAWKRPIVALGHGARVSFISAAGDWPYYHLPSWRHEGLAERDGTPRPAVLNYALIVRELEGASGVERLDLGEDVWAFRVERAEREPLYLLWWDDRLPDLPDEVLPPGRPTSTSVSLDVGAAEVEITYPITELGAVAHETAIIATAGGRLDLELGETPVLVRTSVP